MPDNWSFPKQEAGLNFAELPEGVRVYDLRGRYSDGFGVNPTAKIGYAVHHAGPPHAVGDGTLTGDLRVIDGIHAFHTGPERQWAGIGYHRIIGSGRRIFLVGDSDTQRAHVALLNHQWIGWCILGNWETSRPDEDRIRALIVGTQWETNQRGLVMALAPHKRLNPGTTACPGGWASMSSWDGLQLTPQADPAPTPPPAPGPDPFQRGRREVNDARDLVDARHRAQRAELEAAQRAEIEGLAAAWGIP